jgi:hypothetical protein
VVQAAQVDLDAELFGQAVEASGHQVKQQRLGPGMKVHR